MLPSRVQEKDLKEKAAAPVPETPEEWARYAADQQDVAADIPSRKPTPKATPAPTPKVRSPMEPEPPSEPGSGSSGDNAGVSSRLPPGMEAEPDGLGGWKRSREAEEDENHEKRPRNNIGFIDMASVPEDCFLILKLENENLVESLFVRFGHE